MIDQEDTYLSEWSALAKAELEAKAKATGRNTSNGSTSADVCHALALVKIIDSHACNQMNRLHDYKAQQGLAGMSGDHA